MIQLFRKGTSHIVNGVTCEMQTVNEFSFEHYLEEGWFLNSNDCYKEVPIPKLSSPQENFKETQNLGKVRTKLSAKKRPVKLEI